MILASAGGHVACVIELLEQGADPNARRIVSILNCNICKSIYCIIRVITKYKLLPHSALLQTGTTALFFAAQAGHIDVAKILIRYGANIEAASLVSVKSSINLFYIII